jgi:site-specific recombinase XerD
VQRETDRLRSSRGRAIVQLLSLTGARIGELAELEVDDVRLTQRTGEIVIRDGDEPSAFVKPLRSRRRGALRVVVARTRRCS